MNSAAMDSNSCVSIPEREMHKLFSLYTYSSVGATTSFNKYPKSQ